MNIKLMPRVEDIKDEYVLNTDAIVIDMLRATSVIATAINNGAKQVIPVLETKDAINMREKYDDVVLGGERKGLKIPGFDVGNSPLEYTKEFIKGKTLIITTSNGTRAINGCAKAKHIYIGSMVNGPAVAKKASEGDADISIACAGTLGRFSLDDFICAGYIIDELLAIKKYDLDDISFTAHYVYIKNKDDVEGFIKNASHYNYLLSIGMGEDIKYCCQKSIINIVPEYINGSIKL
ncbi:MAG: 2-phosphosulfolactate phosphatase [Clostridiales bacterium]|nr:2-phosphosulfolactate phosphatase [Clostridiales bacterium]HBM80035.1 2-phosphosulfolactate phosphatase [Clostridiaceae bacterium]